MVSAHDAGIGLAILGVLLLLNPMYLYPDGGPDRVTFELRAERVNASALDDSNLIATGDSAVAACTGTAHRRSCLFERRVGANGTLTVEETRLYRDGDGEVAVSADYRYVYLDGEFYEPRAEAVGGSAVLRLERVNRTVLVRAFSTEFEAAPPLVRRAVRNGSAAKTLTVTERTPREATVDRIRLATPALVRYDGEYVAVRQVRYERRRFALAKYLSYLQTAAFFVGLGLVVYAFQLPRIATEE
ncbi:hypothetical protein [Halorussus salinus]|uniref:hypothetical protein n=1 Tax=Halorussus salinus TaxID=1364935 RepID=UPI0010928BD9|nr:hypothetical protein [Halorussus salinus]